MKKATEFDALPDRFEEYTQIQLHGNITVTKDREASGGLHLSPTPQMALSYHTGTVLRCAVKAADFVLYQPGDFTNVRCKRVTVLGEWKE